MIRVLYVFYGDDFAGGASYSMASLVSNLVKHGVEVHALIPATRKNEMGRYLENNKVICHRCLIPWHIYDVTEKGLVTKAKNAVKAILSLLLDNCSERYASHICRKYDIDVVHIGGAVISTGSRASKKKWMCTCLAY